MKKIFIIWSDFKWEEERILIEWKKLWLETNFLLLEKITFLLWKETKILYEWENILGKLEKNSVFIIRRSRWQFEKLVALVNYLDKKWIKHTDSFWSVSTNLNKKLSLTTIESNIIPHPPFTTFLDKNNYKNVSKEEIPLPCVCKPVDWRHWEWVEIFKKYEDFKSYISKCEDNQIVQWFLKIKSEYRIFTIKWESLWVIEKIPEKWSLLANYAAWAEFKISKLPKSIIGEAIKICNFQWIDIAWYDVAEDKNWNFYTLEVNRCPEFKAFSNTTWINIAKEILTRI